MRGSPERAGRLEGAARARVVVEAARDRKAQDLVVLDVRELSSFADLLDRKSTRLNSSH